MGYLEAWYIINQQSNQSDQSERKLIYQVGPPLPLSHGEGGPKVPRSQGLKVHKWGMVISRSYLNMSLTPKKVHHPHNYNFPSVKDSRLLCLEE